MKQFGFTGKVTSLITPADWAGFELGRVIVEHKERYVVQTETGIYSAEITGNLRYSADGREDFPAVGDWVKMTPMDNESGIILEIFPRTSKLERQAVGKHGEVQLIATNIDYAFIVQSVGHDFNLKRIERYLSICHAAGIEPVIVLTKTDLAEKEEVENLLATIQERVKNVQVFGVSSMTSEGLDKLASVLEPYKTYCFLGSSGVGKSTIINHLKGQEVQKTKEISSSTSKGKHTTTHRELIVLPAGSIVIDTPGMREIGMTDNREGIELTYEEIEALAEKCKFSDCTHISEVGCAVIGAVEEGSISEEAYENYLKLLREQDHFSSTIAEKRKKDKSLGKLYRSVQKERRKNKF